MGNPAAALERFIWRGYFAGLHAISEAETAIRTGADPEAVHELRVAVRRMRSNLRALQPLLDPAWTAETRAALDELDAVAIPVRDTEVMLARIAEVGARSDLATDPRAMGALRLLLMAQEREQAEALRAYLDSEEHLELMQRLSCAADTHVVRIGDDLPLKRTLKRVNRETWRSFRKAARAAKRDAGVEQLHRLRIKAKRMRYLAEVSAPELGAVAERRAKASRRVQQVLGTMHDSVVLCEWLARVRQEAPELADTIAVLLRTEAERQRAQREQWRKLRRTIIA